MEKQEGEGRERGGRGEGEARERGGRGEGEARERRGEARERRRRGEGEGRERRRRGEGEGRERRGRGEGEGRERGGRGEGEARERGGRGEGEGRERGGRGEGGSKGRRSQEGRSGGKRQDVGLPAVLKFRLPSLSMIVMTEVSTTTPTLEGEGLKRVREKVSSGSPTSSSTIVTLKQVSMSFGRKVTEFGTVEAS